MEAENLLTEKIGEGLVRMGEMTQEQVNRVLSLQAEGSPKLFGEIAVDLNYIDLMSVIRYMERLS